MNGAVSCKLYYKITIVLYAYFLSLYQSLKICSIDVCIKQIKLNKIRKIENGDKFMRFKRNAYKYLETSLQVLFDV